MTGSSRLPRSFWVSTLGVSVPRAPSIVEKIWTVGLSQYPGKSMDCMLTVFPKECPFVGGKITCTRNFHKSPPLSRTLALGLGAGPLPRGSLCRSQSKHLPERESRAGAGLVPAGQARWAPSGDLRGLSPGGHSGCPARGQLQGRFAHPGFRVDSAAPLGGWESRPNAAWCGPERNSVIAAQVAESWPGVESCQGRNPPPGIYKEPENILSSRKHSPDSL